MSEPVPDAYSLFPSGVTETLLQITTEGRKPRSSPRSVHCSSLASNPGAICIEHLYPPL